MLRKVVVLGSTGSVGRQTLDVIRSKREKFTVIALTAGENAELLMEQALEFRPDMVAVRNREKALMIKNELETHGIEVYHGEDGIQRCASDNDADIVVNGLVGISGLIPTLNAVEAGKDIALANKETLVAGGRLINERVEKNGVKILPVDSEHSAIYQCIGSTPMEQVKRIILTASGGPFLGRSKEELKAVGIRDALNHPNWKMGSKVTVDSATLMNKGLEVIEARWLFNKSADSIDVVIHPQSIIHSMVEFLDGALLAQLGTPDMRIPIQYALTYPERAGSDSESYDPAAAGRLEFFRPDTETFRCLNLAYQALKEGGTMPVVLNGANEAAVTAFLKGRIPFISIPEVVERVMEMHNAVDGYNKEEILFWDGWSRVEAERIIERIGVS